MRAPGSGPDAGGSGSPAWATSRCMAATAASSTSASRSASTAAYSGATSRISTATSASIAGTTATREGSRSGTVRGPLGSPPSCGMAGTDCARMTKSTAPARVVATICVGKRTSGGPGAMLGPCATARRSPPRRRRRTRGRPPSRSRASAGPWTWSGPRTSPSRCGCCRGGIARHLRAVYDVARIVDDLGDEGDRGPDRAAARASARPRRRSGRAVAGAHAGAAAAGARPCAPAGCPREPFERPGRGEPAGPGGVARYADAATTCCGYCALSADPGRPARAGRRSAVDPADAIAAASDRVCTALQLVEHWQDVAEDRRRGPGLPAAGGPAPRFGVAEADLDAADAPAPRCAGSMRVRDRRAPPGCSPTGAPLVGRLRGWARLAVAGYVAGGRAAVDALRRGRVATCSAGHPPGRRAAATCGRHAAGLLAPAGRRPSDRMTARYGAGLRHLRGRSPGPRPATSTTASGCCPPDKRAALCAVYALARRIDDIGDGDLPTDGEGRRRSPRCARRLATWPAGHDGGDPVLVAVADAARRFPIPLGAFEELVDGVARLDVRPAVRYADLRRAGRVLPVRRRLGRPAVPGRLRQPATATRGAPRYADTLGHRAAADQHPARHPRGPAQRPGLPARTRTSTGSAWTLRVDEHGALDDPDGGLAALHPRSRPSGPASWYADGLRLVAAARPAQRGLHHGDGRHLPRACSSEIAADPRSVYDRRLSLSGRQKARRRRPRPGRRRRR